MKKLPYLLSLPFLAIILYYVFGTNTQNYEQTISQKHKERLHFLQNSSSSPVKNKENFTHSGFFETQKKYRVSAKVEHNPKTEQLAIELSNGKLDTYLHYGTIIFELEGQKRTLVLFQHLERSSEFLLPFTDKSNGTSTYGAGRYLPTNFSGGENIILDFNLAENPYCAFNHDYACPLAPKSNYLDLNIAAGEKM